MRSPDDILREAVAAYQAGRLSEAEAGYRQVLRQRPTSHLALYGLALLSYQAGARAAAIDYVRRSLNFEPKVGLTWNWLGTLYIETGQPDEARMAFRRATEVSPDLGEAWCNLADCQLRDQDADGAAQSWRRALACPPPHSRAFESLADLLRKQGRVAEAAQIVAAWLQREPGNPIAQHMSAALGARDAPSRASDDYVRSYFDDFAAGFDAVLESLSYRGPDLVSSALQRLLHRSDAAAAAAPAFPTLLDAGCGTGLCGPKVRALCARLVGVDLSPKMLDQARQRGCYDELVAAELAQFMRSRPRAFDAIVCADTLVYFGALAEALAAARMAMRGDAPLVFTVEALPTGDPADHRLGTSGRYQHSERYVRRVLQECGLALESLTRETTRKNLGQDVPGWLIVARPG